MAVAQRKPQADDPRAALAAAIEDLAAAKKRVDSHKVATRKCWSAITAAQADAAEAEKGIVAARVDAAAALAEFAVDDADDVLVARPNTVALATAAHADALQTIENLRAARDQLRRTLPDLESDVRTADAAVDAVISTILLPIAQQLLDQMTEAIRLAQPTRELLMGLVASYNDRAIDWKG